MFDASLFETDEEEKPLETKREFEDMDGVFDNPLKPEIENIF